MVIGDNLTDLNKLASAMEKRQEFKTKSTPPSLEFSVRKPTPKIIEPKDNQDPKDTVQSNPDFEEVLNKLSIKAAERDTDNSGGARDIENNVKSPDESSDNKDDTELHQETDRSSQSPERLLDSSTDSVPPSESSVESSQTYTSSLESSSQSPPLDESSLSSEKVGCIL